MLFVYHIRIMSCHFMTALNKELHEVMKTGFYWLIVTFRPVREYFSHILGTLISFSLKRADWRMSSQFGQEWPVYIRGSLYQGALWEFWLGWRKTSVSERGRWSDSDPGRRDATVPSEDSIHSEVRGHGILDRGQRQRIGITLEMGVRWFMKIER